MSDKQLNILHTADTHLGYQQYHKPERKQDFMDAFIQTIEYAINNDIDVYVHAGDLFHDANLSPELQQHVITQLTRLQQNNIRFLAVVGNHDQTLNGDWLDVFEEVGVATRLSKTPVIIGNTAFYGMDYQSEARRERFAYDFKPVREKQVDNNILVSHGQFAPLTAGSWDLNEVIYESPVDFDMILLGDEHQYIKTQINDIQVTYPGSTERTATDQEGERVFNIITLDGQNSITKEELDVRDFHKITVELEQDEGIEEIKQYIDQYEIKTGSVVEVIVIGDGDPITMSDIEQYIKENNNVLYTVARDKREIESDVENINITFTDPDKEIDKTLKNRNFSEGIIELEQLVRDDTIAKTNLRDKVKERVDEITEEEELELFEPIENHNEEQKDVDEEVEESEESKQQKEEPEESTSDVEEVTENENNIENDELQQSQTEPDNSDSNEEEDNTTQNASLNDFV